MFISTIKQPTYRLFIHPYLLNKTTTSQQLANNAISRQSGDKLLSNYYYSTVQPTRQVSSGRRLMSTSSSGGGGGSHQHHTTTTTKASRSNLNPDSKRKFAEKAGYYTASVAIAMFAASFAAVPLYRLYCQATGKGGQAFKEEENKIVTMKKDESRLLTIKFDASTHTSMAWNFKPLQDKVKVYPGETALAFYRATNPLDEPIIGVATYTVLPYEAGVYFNKIQCFCFEEQMLQPHEDVFMPVLFYVDPEICKDPQLGSTDELVLSYTFFRSKDGELEIPDDVDLPKKIELKKH